MSEATVSIIVSIIGLIGTLIAVFASAKTTRDKVSHQMDIEMAVIKTKMDAMDKKVTEHNDYAKMFHENIPVIKEQIKVANHRIEDLEKKS